MLSTNQRVAAALVDRSVACFGRIHNCASYCSASLPSVEGHAGLVQQLLAAGADEQQALQYHDSSDTPENPAAAQAARLLLRSLAGPHTGTQQQQQDEQQQQWAARPTSVQQSSFGALPHMHIGTLLAALPLEHAQLELSAAGFPQLHTAAANLDLPALQQELQQGGLAAATAVDTYNNTALHFAADCRFAHGIGVLLSAGANPNAVNQWHRTPLHYAAMQRQHPALITPLLLAGADVAAADMDGNTPLHVATCQAVVCGRTKAMTGMHGPRGLWL